MQLKLTIVFLLGFIAIAAAREVPRYKNELTSNGI
jgi:hypothetical protein